MRPADAVDWHPPAAPEWDDTPIAPWEEPAPATSGPDASWQWVGGPEDIWPSPPQSI
jgi:hypothetical protein